MIVAPKREIRSAWEDADLAAVAPGTYQNDPMPEADRATVAAAFKDLPA